MSLDIVGIGTAVPAYSGNQDEALAIAKDMCAMTEDHDRMLHAIHAKSGIDRRYTALHEFTNGHRDKANGFYIPSRGSMDRGPTTRRRMERYEREIAPLATEASREALSESGASAESITHLVTVSCTGFSAPGFDVGLVKSLGLNPGVSRTHIGFMGCHAALNGLRTARGYVEADPSARVLLCAAELCTLHMFYGWEPEKMVANALFADGAAASVCVAGDTTTDNIWKLVDNRTTIIDDTDEVMGWQVGDHGFEMILSTKIPYVIEEQLAPWLESWLASHNLRVNDIASWAIHPGGPKIIDSVGAALNLNDEAISTSSSILADYGNMSSPTLLFILRRLKQQVSSGPCIAIGFGPGLTIEAALLR